MSPPDFEEDSTITVVVPEGFGVTFRDGVTSGTRVVLGAAVGASEKKRGMICKRSMHVAQSKGIQDSLSRYWIPFFVSGT